MTENALPMPPDKVSTDSSAEPVANILMVDDRPENLLALEGILRSPGLQLVRALSGAEALKRLLAQDFALILLDVQMPGMDGFETAGMIRSRERSRHTPIIFVTAYDRSESSVTKGYSVGAVDFLFKPIVSEILKSKVSAFVELFRKTEQIKRQLGQIRESQQREALQHLETQRRQWEADRLREDVEREKNRALELERLERDRRYSEQRFRSLVTATSQIIWIADRFGEFASEQHRWTHFTGQSFDELKGHGWVNAVHPEDREKTVTSWLSSVQTQSLYEMDHRLRRRDGHYIPMSVRATPVLEDDGSIREWVGTHTDVSERHRVEDELKRAKEEAEAANIAKSQFLANMSHELRTPLNAVIMYSELLQEEAGDRNVPEFIPDLDRIRNAGRHLLALVNGVLDLAKIEAGKMDLYNEDFDIADLIDDVAATVQPLVQKRDNSLDIHHGAGLGEMHCDLVKLRQILFNLLSNAAKFTEAGTITLDARRETLDTCEFIVIRVTDTGIGVTQEQMAKLFRPFTQADASTTRRFGGTGLGLTISKRFCEMMGGDILATSEYGKGSTFMLRLPIRPVPTVTAEASTALATAPESA